jgi:regulator of protease activity HflC (stomatin/prohibitin superfamily)
MVKYETPQKPAKYVLFSVLAIIVIILLVNFFSFFFIVNPGERGLLLQLGHIKGVYDPGLHFKLPLVNNVVVMDVRTQKDEVPVSAASKDLQEIKATVALNYHLDPKYVDKVYQEVGLEYHKRIISPAIQESVKASTAGFTAEELITKRPAVKEDIKDNLAERLNTYYIIIDDFSIVDFNFSSEFNIAIEAKQTAEQQALKAGNDLKRIEIEAKQTIETAKAEAESIRIQADALKQNKDLIELKAVEKWNGILPIYMLGDAVPFLNMTNTR